jgi:hypothetical protein
MLLKQLQEGCQLGNGVPAGEQKRVLLRLTQLLAQLADQMKLQCRVSCQLVSQGGDSHLNAVTGVNALAEFVYLAPSASPNRSSGDKNATMCSLPSAAVSLHDTADDVENGRGIAALLIDLRACVETDNRADGGKPGALLFGA